MTPNFGSAFRERLATGRVLPLIGVYDAFSAKLAAQRFEGVFCSGFSFAASNYGLPDVGYVNWRDISDFALRVRQILPSSHLLVDIDDGFGDQTIAATVVENLESIGTSAVMFEDQKRPRRCGHYEGKEILPVEEYLVKLRAVLDARETLCVIARTDATVPAEALARAEAYADAGADGVMVEAVKDLNLISKLAKTVNIPIMLNQLHGGKSPNWTLQELQDAGVGIVIYSTPCLFSAQRAMELYLEELYRTQRLPEENTATISDCNRVLFKREPKPRYAFLPEEKSTQADTWTAAGD